MGGSLRLMEWGGPCKWWCSGVSAIVVASAAGKNTKYKMVSSSIGGDDDEVGGWAGRSLRLMEWVVHASCGGVVVLVQLWLHWSQYKYKNTNTKWYLVNWSGDDEVGGWVDP